MKFVQTLLAASLALAVAAQVQAAASAQDAAKLGSSLTLIGAEKAITAGLLPFLPAEALKVALGTAVLTAAWKKAKG